MPLEASDAVTEETAYDPGYEPSARNKIPLRERLGLMNIAVLLVGIVILPTLLAAMALIWAESMRAISAEEPSARWAQMVKTYRITTGITACSAVIRTAVAMQASLTTAMLAAIVLETIGVPLLQGPVYSLMRAFQTTPTSMLFTAKFQPKDRLSVLVFTLLLVEFLITLASQFFSTILISDFALGTYADIRNITNVTVLGESFASMNMWFSTAPSSSWTFAEWSEAFTNGSSFHDTGHTYRSFPPFWDQVRRTKLRSFHGPATVLDHRIVCVRPRLTNLRLDSVLEGYVHLSGEMPLDDADSYSMLHTSDDKPVCVKFTCALPTPIYPSSRTDRETSLCYPGHDGDSSVLLEDPLVYPPDNSKGEFGNGPLVGIPEASTLFIVLDVISMAALNYGLGSRHTVQSVREEGPWAFVSNGSDTEAIRVTTCFANLGTPIVTLDMSSFWDNQEPEMLWKNETGTYDTMASRNQLGASLVPGSPKDRGILSLPPRWQWNEFVPSHQIQQDFGPWFFSMSLATSMLYPRFASDKTDEGSPDQVVILSKTNMVDQTYAHQTHVDLFQDTLRDTQSPALAVQALLGRIFQMAYYEYLVKLNTKVEATTSFSTTALIPQQWTGLAVVISLVAIHLVMMVTITILFLRSTRSSMLGNFWQAVSQVFSKDTEDVVQQADRMTDRNVLDWGKREALGLERCSILQHEPDGRVVLRRQQKH